VYSGSKRAVRGLTDALRVELFNSGVDVVYCAPGWVRSNISAASTRDNLNQVDPKGPWAPCSRVVTNDLFEVEGRAAVTPAQFAKGFVTMALRRHPPGFWSNGVMDGCEGGGFARGPWPGLAGVRPRCPWAMRRFLALVFPPCALNHLCPARP
jgi:hypothetical protein